MNALFRKRKPQVLRGFLSLSGKPSSLQIFSPDFFGASFLPRSGTGRERPISAAPRVSGPRLRDYAQQGPANRQWRYPSGSVVCLGGRRRLSGTGGWLDSLTGPGPNPGTTFQSARRINAPLP